MDKDGVIPCFLISPTSKASSCSMSFDKLFPSIILLIMHLLSFFEYYYTIFAIKCYNTNMKHIGEVITVRSDVLVAEGERSALPPLGTILKSDRGVLCLVVSHSIDNKIPGRMPIAYGKSIEQLEREQPQVFALMKWMFQAIPFGTLSEDSVELFLNKVVEIHTLLFETRKEERDLVFKELRFFDFLFSIDKSVFPQRDKIIVSLVNAYLNDLLEVKEDEYIRIFSYISKILRNDYQTLKYIMDGVGI